VNKLFILAPILFFISVGAYNPPHKPVEKAEALKEEVEPPLSTLEEEMPAEPIVKVNRDVAPREKPETLKEYAKRRTIEIFGGGWKNVDFIIQKESSWKIGAINKSSGACGLGQALPCSKMKCGLSDGKCQVEWTLKYILNRYGSTKNAKAHWLSHNWY